MRRADGAALLDGPPSGPSPDCFTGANFGNDDEASTAERGRNTTQEMLFLKEFSGRH